jgi:hypothetical protein
MKKLIVKAEFTVTPYSPAVEAVEAVEYQPAEPEVWVKEVDGEIVDSSLEKPVLEDGSDDPAWTYHPAKEEILAVEAVEGKPEQPEIKEWRVIAETQGTDEELAIWLEGDKFKYPEGYIVEYIDISQELDEAKKLQAAKEEISKGINALAVFKVRVKNKGLTTAQIGQLFASPEINKIIFALSTGSIPLAIALISNYEADGVIVSEEDKASVIAALA